MKVTVNDRNLNVKLGRLRKDLDRRNLLKIAGVIMHASIMQTFRDEGSPRGSWAPLASWIRPGAVNRISFRQGRVTRGRTLNPQLRPGKKILIGTGRLRNSIHQAIDGARLSIGTNLVYARIHQLGGMAGRRRKTRIPARPYLVFRPEDPAKIQKAMEVYIQSQINKEGLGRA
jgi:phage virion morphogenesis protein